MRFIDTHCHIHLSEFDQDRRAVFSRAREAGLQYMVIVGNDHETNQRLIQLLPELDSQPITLGIHPHHAHEWTPTIASWLRENITLAQVAAVGETGLDYFKNPNSPLLQEKVMRSQIELALEYHLPVVFHMRDAFVDAHRIICEYPQLKFVMHCFTGDISDVEWIVGLGGYISYSGIVTFANAHALQSTVAHVPSNRILVETDSPFLAPLPHRGKRCEPSFVLETVKKLAALRGEKIEDLAESIYLNATKVFGLGDSATL